MVIPTSAAKINFASLLLRTAKGVSVTADFATSADAQAVFEIVNAAYQVENFFKNANRLTEISEIVTLIDNNEIIVLKLQSKIVASIQSTVIDGRGYLAMVAVHPDYQGHGLGALLVRSAEFVAAERGCHEMDLMVVNLRQELLGFYAKFGYQISGEAPYPVPQYATRAVHLLRMTKNLSAHCRNAPNTPV